MCITTINVMSSNNTVDVFFTHRQRWKSVTNVFFCVVQSSPSGAKYMADIYCWPVARRHGDVREVGIDLKPTDLR